MTHENIFRFAVGTHDGPKSSVWYISWTNSDLYLMVRDLMGNRKISLHASGCRTYAFLDDNNAATAKQQSGFPGSTRRICEWYQSSKEIAPGIVLELSIIIPTDDLSTADLWPRDREVHTFPAAPAGMATEVDVCMPRKTGAVERLPNALSVGAGDLSYQHIQIKDNLKESFHRFRKVVSAHIQQQPITTPELYRVISETTAPDEDKRDGPHVIFELSMGRIVSQPKS